MNKSQTLLKCPKDLSNYIRVETTNETLYDVKVWPINYNFYKWIKKRYCWIDNKGYVYAPKWTLFDNRI